MTITTITKIIYIWLFISLAFPLIATIIIYKYKKIKRTLIKSDIANRHYEEMLYASQDGYLTYSIYKKQTFQYCSRRLATFLNLKNGEESTPEEVFASFSTPYKDILNKHFDSLIKHGISFELLATTKNNKTFALTGTKINSTDLDINSNCIWFRDITSYTQYIDKKTTETDLYRHQLEDFRILVDNLPTPIWLRDEKLNISLLNRPYLNLLGLNSFSELNAENSTLHDLGNTTDLKELAQNAKQLNTPQKKHIKIINKGELKKYEITETPYHDSTLKNTHTIGSLIDITSFDDAKRNYQMHLDSHLEILSSLDTAFAILNPEHKIIFTNKAFLKLWDLPQNFTDNTPHYNLFLDKIREQKTLPEVPDFKLYKDEENKSFEYLSEPKEDLLYIPDGRTFKRIRAPHSDGILLAYEDITDDLAITRSFNDLKAVEQGILNNLTDSVAIFTPNLKLDLYNTSFINLLQLTEENLSSNTKLEDIIDFHQPLLPELEDWDSFKNNMLNHLTSTNSFTLKLKDKSTYKVFSSVLPNTYLMITYQRK